MRVKIGEAWFDTNDVAICIQLTEEDFKNITAMDVTTSPQRKYACFPDGFGNAEAMADFAAG